MTVVSDKNYGVEFLTYYYLCDYKYDQIVKIVPKNWERSLGETYDLNNENKFLLRNMYDSLSRECEEYRNIFFPNEVESPERSSKTSWFDLQSGNHFALNIKYAPEKSANFRIRDLTRKAVAGINEFVLNKKILEKNEVLTYEEIRNERFHRISNQIRNHKCKIPHHDEIDLLYMKYAYLYCLNFIEGANTTDNIFFLKFKSCGECELVQVKSREKIFLYKKFFDDVKIEFSTATKGDPHKQTVKYLLDNQHIGFCELRSNKRAMFHLSPKHWHNLFLTIENYRESVLLQTRCDN